MIHRASPLTIACFVVLLSGCTGKTDSATESKTSSIDTRPSSLQTWIQSVQSDEDVLKKLNHFKSQAADSSEFDRWCSDEDVRKAVKDSGAETIIDASDFEKAVNRLREIPSHGTTYTPAQMGEIETLLESVAEREPTVAFSW